MKLEVKIIVRVASPSHSLLISSFFLLLPSLFHSLAFFLSPPFSLSSSPSRIFSFSQHFYLLQSFSLKTSFFHVSLSSQGYSVKRNSTRKALKTWWTQMQKDIMVSSTIRHHKQEHSTPPKEHSTTLPQFLHYQVKLPILNPGNLRFREANLWRPFHNRFLHQHTLQIGKTFFPSVLFRSLYCAK